MDYRVRSVWIFPERLGYESFLTAGSLYGDGSLKCVIGMPVTEQSDYQESKKMAT